VRKRRGEFDQAAAACEEGLAALRADQRTRQDELIEARLHSELGTIYGMRGDYQRARQHIERSLATREVIDDLPGMVTSHNNLGYLWQLQGAYERAIEHFRVACKGYDLTEEELDALEKLDSESMLAFAGTLDRRLSKKAGTGFV
jgi:tetratricopeptide (TPR) repeat protein